MSECPLMVGLGELLWDLLPSGKVLGGAPANFVYMATLLGDRGAVASRLGKDDLGHDACREMRKLGLTTDYVQYDSDHETGTAGVTLNQSGQPEFVIKTPAAWDFLEWTPALEWLSHQTDAVCFGSLAQRSPVSAASIERFLKNLSDASLRICDANLRGTYFNTETLRRSFQYADIVKVNQSELKRIASLFEIEHDDEDKIAHRLLSEFDLKLVCVTRGDEGSLIVSPERAVVHVGFPVTVADTVGAGDAFTACLAHYYLRGERLEVISDRANRFGAWAATQNGAMPEIDSAQVEHFLQGQF